MFWTAFALLFAAPVTPSTAAIQLAEQVADAHYPGVVAVLEKLISFKTVSQEGVSSLDQPEMVKMSAYLKELSAEQGFDFADYGDVVVIGLGQGEDRLGLITHGDVQPADPSKWKQSPFLLDSSSEPGRLLGRGTIDDKGPIAILLQAMQAIAATKLPLKRRVELIISYTEESDWEPFRAFLAKVPPPQLNIGVDSDFPCTVAEKGWSGVWLSVAPLPFVPAKPLPLGPNGEEAPRLDEFLGGSFLSQVPEDATALIIGASEKLLAALKERANQFKTVQFRFAQEGEGLRIRAKGVSAHSADPQDGVNAISFLAALLAETRFQTNAESQVLDFINQMVGTGYLAEKWGSVAFSDPFMGPLTLNLGYLRRERGQLAFAVNFRAPAGKSKEALEEEVLAVIDQWQMRSQAPLSVVKAQFTDPHVAKEAPHVPHLLGIFSAFSSIKDPKPISIGGGSHARLVPFGVNFGPNMPGEVYTGHSEHEFLEVKNVKLMMKIYTAMLYELALKP